MYRKFAFHVLLVLGNSISLMMFQRSCVLDLSELVRNIIQIKRMVFLCIEQEI